MERLSTNTGFAYREGTARRSYALCQILFEFESSKADTIARLQTSCSISDYDIDIPSVFSFSFPPNRIWGVPGMNHTPLEDGHELEALVATLEEDSRPHGPTASRRPHPPTPPHGHIRNLFHVVSACVVGYGVLLLLLLTFDMVHQTTTPWEPHDSHSSYRQDRSIQRYGTNGSYVAINTHNGRVEQRTEEMRLLDQVRFGDCGGFEDILASRNSSTSNWAAHFVARRSAYHCDSGASYREHRDRKRQCPRLLIQRYTCRAPHPTKDDVQVVIERFGPFEGRGGYDWLSVPDVQDVGALRSNKFSGSQQLAYHGGLAAPVYANGTLIGHPPLHIHHAHVHPYGDPDERARKIHGSDFDHHDLLHQSHGDTECLREDGGRACLLTVLPDGMVRVVDDLQSGLSANFELNDVRPTGDEELLQYWFEITLLLSGYNATSATHRRSTHIGINNDCIGSGPCTYVMPYDPHTNVMVYQYTHGSKGSDLGNGYLSNFVLHSHQTMMDSAFLFLSRNDAAFRAADALRGDHDYPLILECLYDTLDDWKQMYSIETAKAEIYNRIVEDHGGQLVCEATKPSVWIDNVNHNVYDKRAHLSCLRHPVPIRVGDVLTVVAFNEVRPHPDVSRNHNVSFVRQQNAFQDAYAVHQHTIFRFDLSHGNDTSGEPDYVPPAYFYYSDRDLPGTNTQLSLDEQLNTGCRQHASGGDGADGTIRFGF